MPTEQSREKKNLVNVDDILSAVKQRRPSTNPGFDSSFGMLLQALPRALQALNREAH